MSNGILIIAHAPLASALRQCAGHVFPERLAHVLALDVQAGDEAEASLAQARALLAGLGERPCLVLTDVLGATPCNVARQLVAGRNARLLTGVNLPMLWRAVCYLDEPLEELTARALSGGAQGVMQVSTAQS